MDVMAAALLEKQLNENLKKLEVRSRSENKKLTQKKSSKGIPVVDAFDISLERTVSKVLLLYIPFLKTFTGKEPDTIKEFVRFCGGVSSTIDKLIDFRTKNMSDEKKPTLQNQDILVIEYVDVIEQMLVKAKGLTPQRPSSDNTQKKHTTLALPFCALCYKRVNQSPYYCRDHHSSKSALAYKKAIRRLISAVYRHSDDEDAQSKLEDHKQGKENLDARIFFRWLNLFSIEPRLIMSELLKLDRDKADWQSYSEAVLTFSREHYPHAYKQVCATGDSASCYDKWIVDVARLLGGEIEANLWKIKDAYIWLDSSNNIQKSLTLLNCLRRYEAFTLVNNFPVLSGAKQGTNTNTAKREQLKQLLIERDNDPSITMNEIAKRLGVSRAAVYKLKSKII
ncbi:HTH domain-containing protein [Vibrio parahaemolyticus]|uniref:HTH domain-containing protein n=2 Tax=Vibrio parahaemolyticus TaxID=670 RepID=UPI002360C286|nr:HTH domain-containing protein [Vibrio parahaemolyticus]ELA7846426.1 HTH domain-containing protein [Vibrio parahaemolyticus]MDF4687486.1 HTH domain-containing protein [Vibrio parahaemolyticus]MDF5516047.1 HTH domain-containing protein [Vibrio parahaemolyticus]MDF5605187.1 HTH domain-containing protein [Vibrio parahaemolyticus]HCG7668885.1 HTH domain-containing protein [Vibrio parahaemolyticus]